MEMFYNSDLYVLVHYPGHGIEIVDKYRRASYMILLWRGAEEFDRASKKFIWENKPNQEEMDDFISFYTGLCNQPIVLH